MNEAKVLPSYRIRLWCDSPECADYPPHDGLLGSRKVAVADTRAAAEAIVAEWDALHANCWATIAAPGRLGGLTAAQAIAAGRVQLVSAPAGVDVTAAERHDGHLAVRVTRPLPISHRRHRDEYELTPAEARTLAAALTACADVVEREQQADVVEERISYA